MVQINKKSENTINVLDENNNFNQVCTYQSMYSLNDNFLVTNDGQYLVVVLNNTLTILSFNFQAKAFQIVYQDAHQSQFNILSLNYKQDKIYLIRDQVNFQIISLVDLSIAQGILNNSWQILDMHISQDEKWLCISANSQGLFIYQFNKFNSNTIQFQMVSSCAEVNFYQFILFKNDSYIIGQDYLKGISIFDLTNFNDQLEQGKTNILLNPSLLNWSMVQGGFQYSSTIEINLEQTLIYVGARSSGIYVIDITNTLSPVVFQFIQIQDDIFQLILSYNLSYLYLSTKMSVFVYQKEQANLQMNYPNMYNKHQSTLSSILNTPYGWRSLLLKDDKTLIVACNNQGVVIAQFNQTSIQQPLYVLSTISYPFNSAADNILLLRNETFLIVPVQDPAGYILDVYDISNKTFPQVVQRIASQTSAYIYPMSIKQDETLFACQILNQLAFYQISGNILFSLISLYEIPLSLSNNQSVDITDMVILNGYPYIILMFRAISICALDITDLINPFVTSKIASLGAEKLVQGTYKKNFGFIADGLQGISVIDLDQLPNLVIISNVQIRGYTNFLNLIMNEQFLITSQLSGGESALVSLSPIQSPQLISQLQYKNEFAAVSSVTSSCNFLFAINAGGVRVFPIKENILIHYEFSQIVKYNTGVVSLIRLKQKDQILSVGQTIQITLNPLYPIQGSQVTNAYLVSDGILYDLPSWMVFDIYQSTLTLSITKDSLTSISTQKQTKSDITQQTVVFVTKLALSQSSFIYNSEITDSIVINENMSEQIFLAYKNIGVINNKNQVSDQFAEDETFTPPNIDGLNLTDEALMKIQRVLQMSLTYSPVDLLLQKSLKVDFTLENNYIQSYSQTASILFIINQQDGKFVNRLYSSVINIQISDGINNDFSCEYQFDQLSKILQVKKIISISPENKLQVQVNNQYHESQIAINRQVDIQFSFNTYNDANFNELQFQAYYIINDKQQELTFQQSEIQFDPQQFKFNIKTSTQDFGREYCLGVNATDTYSWSNILKYSLKKFETQENSIGQNSDTDIIDIFPLKKQYIQAQSIIKRTVRVLNSKNFLIREINYQNFKNYITNNQEIDAKAFIKDLLTSNQPINQQGKYDENIQQKALCDIQITDLEQIQSISKNTENDTIEKFSPILFESCESEGNSNKVFHQNQEQNEKHKFKLILYDQYINGADPQEINQCKLINSNIQQLNRKIQKSVNPFQNQTEDYII
ncbi:hypothetical protein TTHERM_00155280 (macronuclear) [Tetrahymena thermophila SB210]|uniref:Calpain family cysteine protease n=1 Tax=Tetrahymena thermophila (strain SB210) TaxID=312017 RepID=Q22WK6_TETTS|nr:hypothetical protein TTHERM_00155280 [Tetrahymena thermophila SB210]EAR89411.2 hypothetical protein TTHERM_00155280 [Tetrahymena thermophila SB210]|eukprot:XP_001009656.2 hypothetical protein TTHERM_00155280 [Tetrahymena thermophila SB210]